MKTMENRERGSAGQHQGAALKKGWQTKTLGELCDVLDHKRKPITKRDRDAGEYPYYGATGVLDHVAGYLFDEPLVLVGEDGAKWTSGENTAFAVDGKIWVNNNAHVLRPHRTVLLDNWLIYHLNHSDLNEFVSGLTVPKLNQGSLREIPVPVPPLAEQQRIVGLLDEAFEGLATAKANAEKNLQNARALFESHLQSVFTQGSLSAADGRGPGWVEKHLKEVCEKITDGTHQTPKYFDEGVVFLSSRNVTSGTIDWDRIKYIDTKQHLEMHKRVAPRRNDILLAKNGTTGVAAIVDRDTTFDIYVSLALLRALPVMRPRFLLHFINSPAAKVQFNKRLKGVGVPNLHLEEIREVRLAFPADLKAQDRVVDELDDLR
jgi:type I restriction enzyme S subunit